MKDLRTITSSLFQQDQRPLGDEKTRPSFYDYETGELETRKGKPVKLAISPGVSIPHYGKKKTRQPIYIPDKLLENMRDVLGVESEDEYKVTTTLIVLADYALQQLLKQEQTVHVSKPKGVAIKTL